MPTTGVANNGLAVLVKKGPLSTEDWVTLLEASRKMFQPYLNELKIWSLGEVECLHYAGDKLLHSLNEDEPEVRGGDEYSLTTPGIFFPQWWTNVDYLPYKEGDALARSGTLMIWGITHSEGWLLVTVKFTGTNKRHARGWEEAKTVTIEPAALTYILTRTKETPQRMWEELSILANQWLRYYEEKSKETSYLWNRVSAINEALTYQ